MHQAEIDRFRAAVTREVHTLSQAVDVERAFGGYKYRQAFKVTDLELAVLETKTRERVFNQLVELGSLKACLIGLPFGRAIIRRAMRRSEKAAKEVARRKADARETPVDAPVRA